MQRAPAASAGGPAAAGASSPRDVNGTFRDFDLTETVELGGHVWEFTGGVLGSGAFSVVLDAWNTSVEGHAAVKVLETDTMSPWHRRQSESEVALWSSLNHPNIVRFLGHVTLHKWLLLFSEPLDGGELMDHILQGEAFLETEVATIMRQLLAAVEHMHELRICHRDIKPQNVVCAERPEGGEGEWRVKLCDFGHAKRLDDEFDAQLHTPRGILEKAE